MNTLLLAVWKWTAFFAFLPPADHYPTGHDGHRDPHTLTEHHLPMMEYDVELQAEIINPFLHKLPLVLVLYHSNRDCN